MYIIQSLARTLGISRTLTWGPLEAKLPSLAGFSMLVLTLEFLSLPALSSSFTGLFTSHPLRASLVSNMPPMHSSPLPPLYQLARAAGAKCKEQELMFSDLKARGLESRAGRTTAPLERIEFLRSPSRPPLYSPWLPGSLGLPWLVASSSLCLCHQVAFSLGVPVISQHLRLRAHQSCWTRNHATQVQLSLNQ